jgi:thioesterase domain-containing protein
MARELRRSGEIVERLIMIDAVNRDAPIHRLRWVIDALMRAGSDATSFNRRAEMLEALQYYAGRLEAAGRMNARQRVRWAAGVVRRLVVGRSDTSDTASDPPPADDDNLAPALARGPSPEAVTLRALSRAVVTYKPRPYDGELELIFPATPVEHAEPGLAGTSATGSPAPGTRSAARGWDRVSPRVHVHQVSGTHLSIIVEHVDALAECMRACLRLTPAPASPPVQSAAASPSVRQGSPRG